jgi:hypothetical protein
MYDADLLAGALVDIGCSRAHQKKQIKYNRKPHQPPTPPTGRQMRLRLVFI